MVGLTTWFDYKVKALLLISVNLRQRRNPPVLSAFMNYFYSCDEARPAENGIPRHHGTQQPAEGSNAGTDSGLPVHSQSPLEQDDAT